MSWVRIDDHLADHPKVLGLDRFAPLALALQVRALCYASRYLTDGHIPAGAIPGLLDGFEAWGIETGGVKGLCGIGSNGDEFDWPAMMVRAGLWEKCRKGGYMIHDFLEYNPSRKDRLAEREANAKRQQAFRERNGSRNGVTNGLVQAPPAPTPLREPKGSSQKPSGASWLSPYFDAWVDQYGGKPNPKELASHLAPVRAEIGDAELLSRWRRYLGDTEARFNPRASKFAAVHGSYGEPDVKVMTDENGVDRPHRKNEAGEWVAA